MYLLFAILVTALVVGVLAMIVGMFADRAWLVYSGAALAAGCLLVVLAKAFIEMWARALS
jgi:hypothetical protein